MTNPAPPPHRTQIPNIVDDLGLDPYERALYVHYKRVCGENQGAYCFEATRTTAGKVKMSTGQVSLARKSLAERGLIIVQAESRPVVVTVINIWEINTAFYKLEHRPDVDGWTVEQVKIWLHDMSTDVHPVNVSSHNDIDTRSPSEHSLTESEPRSPSEHQPIDMSSDVHTVKQRIDSSLIVSSPRKESERDSPAPIPKTQRAITIPAFKVYFEVTEYHAITKHWRGEMARIVGDAPEDLDFWRKVIIGWTGKYPSKHNVEGMLDFYKRREIPGYQKSSNGIHPANKSSPLSAGQREALKQQQAQDAKEIHIPGS